MDGTYASQRNGDVVAREACGQEWQLVYLMRKYKFSLDEKGNMRHVGRLITGLLAGDEHLSVKLQHKTPRFVVDKCSGIQVLFNNNNNNDSAHARNECCCTRGRVSVRAERVAGVHSHAVLSAPFVASRVSHPVPPFSDDDVGGEDRTLPGLCTKAQASVATCLSKRLRADHRIGLDRTGSRRVGYSTTKCPFALPHCFASHTYG
jgi:hypothetical protein